MRDRRLITFARSNRRAMSDAERIVWYWVRNETLGARFRRQHPIGPYIADFACLSHRIVLEVDGRQHIDSRYDQARDEYMRARGWTVLRFWASHIVTNMEDTRATIAAAIDAAPRSMSPLARGRTD